MQRPRTCDVLTPKAGVTATSLSRQLWAKRPMVSAAAVAAANNLELQIICSSSCWGTHHGPFDAQLHVTFTPVLGTGHQKAEAAHGQCRSGCNPRLPGSGIKCCLSNITSSQPGMHFTNWLHSRIAWAHSHRCHQRRALLEYLVHHC